MSTIQLARHTNGPNRKGTRRPPPCHAAEHVGTVIYLDLYEPGGWASSWTVEGTLAVCSYYTRGGDLRRTGFRWHVLDIDQKGLDYYDSY